MTYKALGRSISNYTALSGAQNASKSNIDKIQRAQNEVLRMITGSHKMSSIDHLHRETEMLQVEDHLNLRNIWYIIWIQITFVMLPLLANNIRNTYSRQFTPICQ